jgi:hypothetical protein
VRPVTRVAFATTGRTVTMAILALAVVACASTGPTAPPAAASIHPRASEPSPKASAAPSVAPTRPSAAPGSNPATTAAVGAVGAVEDPSLIGVLPATVDGVPVNLEHQAFVDAVADPAFAQHVRRAAFGVAVDGQDLASGVVAELVPGIFSDAFFRDWRDTYDAGACGQSGGVVGNAETQIDGRTAYIATCAGGLRTYHAWLPERESIVSAFSLGDRRLGEALMEGLRP